MGEKFVRWSLPRPTMTGSWKKLPLKRALEPRRRRSTFDEESPHVVEGQMRLSNEQRTKQQNDGWHVDRHANDKEKAIATSSTPRKRCRWAIEEDRD